MKNIYIYLYSVCVSIPTPNSLAFQTDKLKMEHSSMGLVSALIKTDPRELVSSLSSTMRG